MTPTELQFSACLLLARAEKLPKGDPEVARLLLGAKALLDRSERASEELEERCRRL